MKQTIIQYYKEHQIPIMQQDLNDKNLGIYYGREMETGEPIFLNRVLSSSPTGFVSGFPGTGIALAVKQELLNVLLSSDDEVFILDLHGDFCSLANEIGGEVVQIGGGFCNGVNPLSWYPSPWEEEFVLFKQDFLKTFIKGILEEPKEFSPAQISIINRSVSNLYQSKSDKDLYSISLYDFYEELKKQAGSEAQELERKMMECLQCPTTFSIGQGVSIRNRFTVFDLSKVYCQFKTVSLLAVTEFVWNRVMNSEKSRTTDKYQHIWLYFNDINGFLKTEESTEYIRNLSKRCRTQGCVPTFITKQTSEILNNDITRTMISNSGFIQLFYQEPAVREELAYLLALDSKKLAYISNNVPGSGLIYADRVNGCVKSDFIPFQYNALKEKFNGFRLGSTGGGKAGRLEIF